MSTERKALSEVADVNPRLPASIAADVSRLVDFVPMAQLSESGFVSPNGSRPLSEVLKGYTYFANGDVIVAKITPCMENGKAAFVDNLPSGIAFGSTEFHVLRPRTGVFGKYLFYSIWNQQFRDSAASNMSGSAGQKRVPTKFFDQFSIPLPPFSKQKRIAEILDRADAIRRKRQAAIANCESLTGSLFYDMFTGRIRSCEWIPLASYVKELRYGTSNKSGDSGYVTLRIPNILRGVIDVSNLKTVDATESEFDKLKLVDGDVLFVRTNGNPDNVGRCAVFEQSRMLEEGLDADNIIYASYLIRARLQTDRIRPTFLQTFLQTPAGRRDIRDKCRTSAGQYNINTKGIGSLKIPVIPLGEQLCFEERVNSFRPLQTKLVRAHCEADDLFHSLLKSAFLGEL